jgi:hypothetical protein
MDTGGHHAVKEYAHQAPYSDAIQERAHKLKLQGFTADTYPKPSNPMRDEYNHRNHRHYLVDESYFREKGNYHALQWDKILRELPPSHHPSSLDLKELYKFIKADQRLAALQHPDPTLSKLQMDRYRIILANIQDWTDRGMPLENVNTLKDIEKKQTFWDVQTKEKLKARRSYAEKHCCFESSLQCGRSTGCSYD